MYDEETQYNYQKQGWGWMSRVKVIEHTIGGDNDHSVVISMDPIVIQLVNPIVTNINNYSILLNL